MQTRADEALGRPRDHRGDGAPRRRHAAAVPLAVLDVVPPGRPTPTSCRRASCRRASTSPTTSAVLASRVPFLQIYWNSVMIAVVVTVGQLVTCTLAAFAFARLELPRPRRALLHPAGRADVPRPGHDPADLSRLRQGRPPQPADRPRADVPDLELRGLPDAPVHAEPAQGARGGGADGRRGLLQDLLAHLAAAAPPRALGARHHHLHPDLELLLPGQGAARHEEPR